MTAPDDTAAPAGRRRRVARPTVTVPLALLLVGVSLAGCDTGDGKTLQPPSVAFTTTVAPPVTLLSVPLVTDDLFAATTTPIVPAFTNAPDAPSAFQAFVPWANGAPIDPRYGCDGENIAPAVSWTPPPAGTSELAIVLADESAVDGDGPFIHWIMVGVDPNDLSLLEGDVPPGAVNGLNSFGSIGYSGPCPPAGDAPHVYRLTVYALNQQSELADGTPASNLLEFITDVAIGATSLTGTAAR